MLQGSQDARRDIAQGKFTKRRVIGGHPLPLTGEQSMRMHVEERIWKRLGVPVRFEMAPDVVECWNPPYHEGYDAEVDKYLRLKLGNDYAEAVERELQRQLESSRKGRGSR